MQGIAISPLPRHTKPRARVNGFSPRLSRSQRWFMTISVLTIIIAVLALAAGLFVLRAVSGMQRYFHFRGMRLVTCPETHKPEAVDVGGGGGGGGGGAR